MQITKLAAALGFIFAAAACAPVSLHPVRTWEELQAQRVYRTADDWQVQLGWCDSGPAGGPWVMVYASTKYVGTGDIPQRRYPASERSPLGPVFLRVIWNDMQVVPDAVIDVGKRILPSEGSYCQVVQLVWPGNCVVQVCQADGQVLAGKTFTVAQAPLCYWHDFAQLYGEAGSHAAALAQTHAVYPEFGGLAPLPASNPAQPLPGYMEGPSLKLELRDGRFAVTSPVDMLDWPDWCLMARWWVNGQPIPAERRDFRGGRALGRAITAAKQMAVEFGYPDTLGVKVGDKLALRVMYVPQFEYLTTDAPGMDRFAGSGYAALQAPALSNPIEFVVTEDLMKRRATNQAASRQP